MLKLKRYIKPEMLISNIVGVLTGAVSFVVGVYLGHALQKPRLSIVDLDQTFYNQSHTLSDQLRKQLTEQPVLVDVLRVQLERAAVGKDEDPCTAWLDGDDWPDRC